MLYAGGAAVGYHCAGFLIVGVDNRPQPRYPFPFIQMDALEAMDRLLAGEGLLASDGRTYYLSDFDAIHASPPCQGYSRALRHLAAPQPMLVDAVRERMNGTLYVIENVPGVVMPVAFVLCGTAFGLRVYRHRYFETSVMMLSPGCAHERPAMNPHSVAGRKRMIAEYGNCGEVLWRNVMGVPWMNKAEAREAIPPVFTEYIGRRLMEYLNA